MEGGGGGGVFSVMCDWAVSGSAAGWLRHGRGLAWSEGTTWRCQRIHPSTPKHLPHLQVDSLILRADAMPVSLQLLPIENRRRARGGRGTSIDSGQAYHSAFNADPSVRQIGNMAVLPISTKIRGPAPIACTCGPDWLATLARAGTLSAQLTCSRPEPTRHH